MAEWLDLKDKVIIVTGGSSGIGAVLVDHLLAVGAKVVNFDLVINDKQNENLLQVTVDVTSKQAIDEGFKQTLEKWGRLDGLVNNAGINVPALLVDDQEPESKYELTEELLDKIYAINQKSVFLCSQAAARIFVKQKKGVIINMSSESGLEGSQGQSPYAATKAAIYSFTRSWAKELGKFNVRVVGVAPGIIEATGLRTLAYEEALAYTRGISVEKLRQGYESTSTTPLGRSGKLGEVADTVCFLLSDRAGYTTGVTYNVAGGKTRG